MEEQTRRGLTGAVASPFALMTSITGLLDVHKTSMKDVNQQW